MMQYILKRKTKLTRRSSHEMIQLSARHGNHYKMVNFKSDADVKRIFAQNGFEYDTLVETCRDPNNSVPFFENLIGSTWTASGGVTISRVDLPTGEEETENIEGPGTFSQDGYWATYETAHEALDRAIARTSYSDFLSAVVHGIASIEAFLAAQILEWNKKNPDKELFDSKQNKVSFDDKINEWIPVITKGTKFDKSGKSWQDFKVLRSIRDNEAIHPKSSGHAVKFDELVRLLNLFPNGISGLLVDLHILFKQKIPRVIIRDKHSPDVELIEESPTGIV